MSNQEKGKNETFLIGECDSGGRLDKLLSERFKSEHSRSYFHKLFDEGKVYVNGCRAKKQYRTEPGDTVSVTFLPAKEVDLTPEAIALTILYEDEDLLVINKPAGLCVHPAPGNWSHTLVHGILYHCTQISREFPATKTRPGIVHRLDKDTSGVMVIAKTARSHTLLVEAFSKRQVYKEYLAVTLGNPGADTIVASIGRDPVHRKKMCVTDQGAKDAVTDVQTYYTDGSFSFVKAVLRTGRTHQIRVHLKYKGTPLLGDQTYGHKQINERWGVKRQLLHAYKLQFTHPITKNPLALLAPMPDDIFFWKEKLSKHTCVSSFKE